MEPNIIDIRPLEIISRFFAGLLEGVNDIQMGMNNNDRNQETSLKKNNESCSTEATTESFDDYHRPIDNRHLHHFSGEDYDASTSNAACKDSIDGTTGSKTSNRTQSAPRAIENIPQSCSYDRSAEDKEFERMRYDFATHRMYDRITSARQNQQQEILRRKYQSKTAKLKR